MLKIKIISFLVFLPFVLLCAAYFTMVSNMWEDKVQATRISSKLPLSKVFK